jgi:oligopeptidase A
VTTRNPLLNFDQLPKFDAILPEHIVPAISQLIQEGRACIQQLGETSEAPNWENFVRPLEDMEERLSRAWSQVGHMNAVVNTPELREAYNTCLPTLTEFYSDLGQDEKLYQKFKHIKQSNVFAQLSSTQQKIIENELRDFKLGGAELPASEKQRFKAIQESLSLATTKFEENLMDTVNAFELIVEKLSELAGVPEDVITTAKVLAEKEGKSGYKFTLHAPSYLPVLQYADNRELREKLYRAYATRASEFGPAQWDNTSLMNEILAYRLEVAKLLGFDNYAQMSLTTKMANSPEEVIDFLNNLVSRAKPFARQDMEELTVHAKKLGIDDLQAWDVAYVSEKLREQKYAFSDQEIKQYFPENYVLGGLFKVVQTIFGIRVEKSAAPVWHPDVSFYELKNRDGHIIGQFYLDLYARNNKRGGAWMDEAITRRRIGANEITTPVAYLTCNFSAPIGDKPALFTHDEVITLFHEFGHGLHHMLTQVEHYSVSGIKGVEWDAVELPSQFMENFCWEWDVISAMTSHVDTGEPLPQSLFKKMIAAKNFQAGMQTVRQLEFSLFDMKLHHGFMPDEHNSVLTLIEQIRDEVAVVRPPQWNRFPHGFSHIFAGGYAAGYYSYKWAEVLSADAYSLFEENGVLCAETGQRFWHEILAQGGSRPALDSFIAFRGRAPDIEALLRHNGMTVAH